MFGTPFLFVDGWESELHDFEVVGLGIERQSMPKRRLRQAGAQLLSAAGTTL
jgi:hypothetical protein